MRLLMVEDDALLGNAVHKALSRGGFAVDWVQSGAHFESSLATHDYDFVLLDLGLPDKRGEELLRRLLTRSRRIPVIVMTARGGVQDRVALLDLGADDYLVKPFDLDELAARVRSVLRRAPVNDGSDGALEHGALRLDPKRFRVTWQGQPVPLTHREFWVLEALVRNRNLVMSRAKLEEALYGWGEEIDSNAVEVYVHFLRRKLGPDLIQTVRGMGYQLAPLKEHAKA